jgi:protein-S-isoprenylcysteine O-methyltransferase Ste14
VLTCGCTQAVGLASLTLECAVLLGLYLGSAPASRALAAVCGGPLPSVSALSALSPVFSVAVGMVYAGTLLRLWCDRTLGTLFTYELTIRPGHKLIMSGPYAIVRHPSYTTGVLLVAGMALAVLAPHGDVHECGLMATPVRWVVLGWVGALGYAMVSLAGQLRGCGAQE